MRSNYVFGYRQTEACALTVIGARVTALAEFFEDRPKTLRWDARAGVFHRNFQDAIAALGRDRHLPSLGREFDGVAHEVAQHLQNLRTAVELDFRSAQSWTMPWRSTNGTNFI